MKVLCYAQNLEIGGTQVNAIELASMLRNRYGFDITMFAVPGPMVTRLRSEGLTYVPAPSDYEERGRSLQELVVNEKPDLVHVWDFWQVEHAFYRVCIPLRRPIVVTSMEMNVPAELPRSLPTTFGTVDLLERARAQGFKSSHLLFPAVNVTENAPGAVDSTRLRKRFQISREDILLVIVSRLTSRLKGEGLYDAIEATRRLGREYPVRLLIVGEGGEQANLETLADRVNNELGRPVISVAGPLLDPRPAYEAANIVVGMGGSALRGMAFGKPVIVVGSGGFALTLTPQSADYFYHFGIYGRSQRIVGENKLATEIRAILQDDRRSSSVGAFGREFVVRNYSLDILAERFATLCRQVPAARVSTGEILSDVVRLKGGVLSCGYRACRKLLWSRKRRGSRDSVASAR
jgi:L-malate glycosyltransferase